LVVVKVMAKFYFPQSKIFGKAIIINMSTPSYYIILQITVGYRPVQCSLECSNKLECLESRNEKWREYILYCREYILCILPPFLVSAFLSIAQQCHYIPSLPFEVRCESDAPHFFTFAPHFKGKRRCHMALLSYAQKSQIIMFVPLSL